SALPPPHTSALSLHDALPISYFHNRPLDSQLSALASPQSSVIPNRAFLEDAVEALAAKYEGAAVPLPRNCGGYRVIPQTIEFWRSEERRVGKECRRRWQPDQR